MRAAQEPSKDRIQRMVQLPASAGAVWEAIGDPMRLADWHPLVDAVDPAEVEGEPFRHVKTADGNLSFERIVERGEHHHTYEVVDTQLPMADHRATLAVVAEKDGGCHVFWSAVFRPTDGEDALCDRVVGDFYEAGLDALLARFG